MTRGALEDLATTYEEIRRYLDAGGFRYSITAEDTILTGFGEMEEYRDVDGRSRLGILITLEESGGYVRFVCPRLYRYLGVRNKADLFQTCLMLNYWAKLVQFEFDDRDGELRAAIELPVEDAQLTQAQLARCLTALAYLIDRFDPMIRKTISEGGIYVPREPITY